MVIIIINCQSHSYADNRREAGTIRVFVDENVCGQQQIKHNSDIVTTYTLHKILKVIVDIAFNTKTV